MQLSCRTLQCSASILRSTICSGPSQVVSPLLLARRQLLTSTAPDTNLHNILPPTEPQAIIHEKGSEDLEPPPTGTTATAVPSTKGSSIDPSDGTWGERDVGGPVSHRIAMEDYEEMRRELTHLSQSRADGQTVRSSGAPRTVFCIEHVS